MSSLALLGGKPIIKNMFSPFNTIGKEERQSVLDVLDDGVLSGFVGAPGEEFNGGRYVQELENNWCEKFNVKHAIDHYQNARQKYYEELSTFDTFGRGWTRRVEETTELALNMIV